MILSPLQWHVRSITRWKEPERKCQNAENKKNSTLSSNDKFFQRLRRVQDHSPSLIPCEGIHLSPTHSISAVIYSRILFLAYTSVKRCLRKIFGWIQSSEMLHWNLLFAAAARRNRNGICWLIETMRAHCSTFNALSSNIFRLGLCSVNSTWEQRKETRAIEREREIWSTY